MDPDIPALSIEPESHAAASSSITNTGQHLSSPSTIALPPSSPLNSPYKPAIANSTSASPRRPSRSPSSMSSHYNERQTTPTLLSKRSISNLSTSRGATPSQPQFRRASSNLNPSSPVPGSRTAALSVQELQAKQLTASSVAKEYFRKELELHASTATPFAVFVHDSCYGHRFSRPRSSKATLSMVVERPERMHAALLGASAAYVRLGGRHAAGSHPPHPERDPSTTSRIPFQIRKTSRFLPLTHPCVTHVHGPRWMEELQIMCDSAEGKLALNGKELVRPIGYGKDENGKALPKLHEGDLYLSSESLHAFQGCLGGVCDAVDAVFTSATTKRAFVCIRPPGHHCSSNFPSGFCWLNNVHVGIAYAAMNHGLTHAAIIDFDLHHGDGSQSIAWDHNRKAQGLPKNAAPYKKTPIGYYSLHDINSYPCEWGDEDKVRNASLCIENAHGQSIWNVHLEPWKSHEEFWKLYDSRYRVLLEKAKVFLRHHTTRLRASGTTPPKAAIFISAGFDASEWEGAGMQRHKVNVPTDFYAKFTADLIDLLQEEDLGVDGRVISVLEGGYSDRALTSGVLGHVCGLAGDIVDITQPSPNAILPGLAPIDPLIGLGDCPERSSQKESYDSSWWAAHRLADLESVVAGCLPQPSKIKPEKTSNYSSPTRASTAKMTDHARVRRSLSAQLEARLSLESQLAPPPPEVDWAVASYELSRLIIPADRQTLSCTHEELSAEATRARRERPSAVDLPASADQRMQLRDRKAKIPPTGPAAVRAASRHDPRRTTIASIDELPDPGLDKQGATVARPRRRSSAASSILSSFQDMTLSDSNTEAVQKHYTPDQSGSAASRASSVVSEQPSKTVVVKRTRAAPTVKSTAKPKSSPRKAKSASASSTPVAGNRTASTTTVVDTRQGDDGTGDSAPSRHSSGSTAPKTDEMENVTNGIKKISIKLKMPTAEEHAARQAKAEEEKQKKSRASKKPLISRVPKTRSVQGAHFAKAVDTLSSNSLPLGQPSVGQTPADTTTAGASPGHLTTENKSQDPSTAEPVQMPYSAAQPAQPPPSTTTPQDNVPVALDQLSQSVANGNDHGTWANTFAEAKSTIPSREQQVSTVEQGPIHPAGIVQKPSTSLPVFDGNRKIKSNLPVFTSQSVIPFATNTFHGRGGEEKNKDENEPSIWDIPETPRRDA